MQTYLLFNSCTSKPSCEATGTPEKCEHHQLADGGSSEYSQQEHFNDFEKKRNEAAISRSSTK
jgi:hypothetical protein